MLLWYQYLYTELSGKDKVLKNTDPVIIPVIFSAELIGNQYFSVSKNDYYEKNFSPYCYSA